jgi:hypothetical protein
MRLEGESVIEDGAEVGELEDFGDWEGGRGEDWTVLIRDCMEETVWEMRQKSST